MGKFNMSKYDSKYKEGKYTTKPTRYPDYSQKTIPSSSINNNYIEYIQSLTGQEIFDLLNSIPFDIRKGEAKKRVNIKY